MDLQAHYSHPPVHRGDSYCSPWCGFGCSKRAYDQAVSEADHLAKRMGASWEPRVWENGGWHYEVSCGDVRISTTTVVRGEHGQRTGSGALQGGWTVESYTCWLSTSSVYPQVYEASNTPEEALALALDKAQTQVTTATNSFNKILVDVGRTPNA